MNLPFVNQQPVEKRLEGDGSLLDVQEIFPTIQGEGPFAGVPSVFIRLAGCNLSEGCRLCDTDYTSRRKFYKVEDIVATVGLFRKSGLVVITGGEPLRQPLGRLVRKLTQLRGYQVQIETNGTLFDETLEGTDRTIVCSPKTGSINQKLELWINAYKYVLSADQVDPTDGLPMSSLGFGVRPARPWNGFEGEVFVSPCDERDRGRNEANIKVAVDSCQKFGYRLSLQLHKIIGLP